MKFSRMYNITRRGLYSFGLLSLFVVYSLMTSCVSTKKVVYFQDIRDSTGIVMIDHPAKFMDPTIESNDNLAITLQTVIQNNTNTPITTNSVGTFNELNGYLVDKNGYVEIPLIGFVKVGGLTTAEAREVIKQKAKDIYNNPVVNVRIANFEVTILGDVGKPGKIILPSEKASIIDAIALSGDLNLTAKRDNILLIRSEGDEKKCVRFDMRSTQLFQSPYFYLKQRDLIYVEPNKGKIQSSDNTLIRNLGILSSIISIFSLAIVFKSLK